MRKERLNKYRYYRNLLIECKKIQISNYLDEQIENRMPTYRRKTLNKQKRLTLFS